MDNNKACPNCEFDTMPIVTVDLNNWDYCPICGSGLRSIQKEMRNDEEEDTEMRQIAINGSSDSENGNDDAEPGETEPDTVDDEEVDIEEELEEEENFVEEELDRLRDRFGSDDEDQ